MLAINNVNAAICYVQIGKALEALAVEEVSCFILKLIRTLEGVTN